MYLYLENIKDVSTLYLILIDQRSDGRNIEGIIYCDTVKIFQIILILM